MRSIQKKSFITALALGLFFIFHFSFFIPSPAHAQFKILSSPTGNCPDFQQIAPAGPTPAGAQEIQSAPRTAGQALNPVLPFTVDPLDKSKMRVVKLPMQCKQGMCFRPATAGAEYTVQTDIPCNYSIDDIWVTVLNVVRIIFAVTGSLALLMFIVGGLYWVLAAGEPARVKRGKDIITNSLIAIVITFGAGVIVTFVTKGLGANIAVNTGGSLGVITSPDAQCPAGGKQGDNCKNNTLENMQCLYGELDEGAVSAIEGQCVSECQYHASPPYNGDSDDLDPNYQCTDKTVLPPDQQRTCEEDLCPGADNIQCCKI